jgi:PKD repeat protein
MTRHYIGIAAVIIATIGISCGKDQGLTAPTTTPPASANHAPVASAAVAPAATAIAGATTVTFTATASDADGDAVTFNWQFGDGQTATGQSVRHTFGVAGPYAVVLAATDSHGDTTKVTTNVVVKGLTGKWVDADPRVRFTLTQDGAGFSGLGEKEYSRLIVEASVVGTVADPRSLAFELTYDRLVYPDNSHTQFRCYYEGTLDASGDAFNARINTRKSDRLCRDGSFTATRQP